MSTPFVDAVDAELATLDATIASLVEMQRELTPQIFTLRSQRQALVVYRRALVLESASPIEEAH